jgi:hypothetical protein
MPLVLNGTDGLSDVDGTAATPAIRGTDTNTGIFFPAADTIAFSEGGTESMRLDSNGSVLINTTTNFGSSGTKMNMAFDQSSNAGFVVKNAGSTYNSNPSISFINDSNGSAGFIILTSATTTAYVTTSDYRLKKNIAPMIGALATVAALKPVTYKWKADGSDGQGFIAHELQEVVPDCVVGKKDAVNEDGNIKPQGIDTSFLVATLTAAIQELKSTVDAQAARIAALEAK